MTALRSAWGSSKNVFELRQEGISKMMALSVFLHLFFFAFIIFNHVLWKIRQPPFQGFQVNLVSPGSGFGESVRSGSARSRSSLKTATQRQSKARSNIKTEGSKKKIPVLKTSTQSRKSSDKGASAKKSAVSPKRTSITKLAAKPPSVPSRSNRMPKMNESIPPPPKEDPERLEEWWKKKTKALKVPTTTPAAKAAGPASRPRRTAKIDIERKSIVVPPVALSDQVLPKSKRPPNQEHIDPLPSNEASNGLDQKTSNKLEQPPTSPGSASLGEDDGSEAGNREMTSLGPTGGMGIIGTGGGETGIAGFKFPGYLQKIDNKIRWQWAPPRVGSKEDSLTLRFDINKDGSIDKTSIVVEESSGNTFFDQAAIRAVHAAHPFPPLPKSYTEDLLRVYMNFVVQEES